MLLTTWGIREPLYFSTAGSIKRFGEPVNLPRIDRGSPVGAAWKRREVAYIGRMREIREINPPGDSVFVSGSHADR
jgi:hypothetical protein